jgi:hypothetical protein
LKEVGLALRLSDRCRFESLLLFWQIISAREGSNEFPIIIFLFYSQLTKIHGLI